jgi:hypothetical protein
VQLSNYVQRRHFNARSLFRFHRPIADEVSSRCDRLVSYPAKHWGLSAGTRWLALTEGLRQWTPPDTTVVFDSPQRKWEVVSAYQKCVRRGSNDWAQQLVGAVLVFGPEQRRYFWTRITATACEDVGYADPELMRFVIVCAALFPPSAGEQLTRHLWSFLLIYPGLVPGGETGWAMLTGANPEPGAIDVGMFRYVAHEDPAWDWRTFDLERDTALIDKKAGFIDAVNPDLSAFRARGGKLLIYHGWNDGGSGGAISPQNSVNYYSSVLTRMGSQQHDWLRLSMVPGMAHCGGGSGPNQVNWMAALERWRESGIAPDQLIAARVSDNRVNMTRPICPYPQVARYNGVGSTNDAATFTCKMR